MARASQTNQNGAGNDSTLIDFNKNHSGYPTITPAQDLYFAETLTYKTALLSQSSLTAMDSENKEYVSDLKEKYKSDYISSSYTAFSKDETLFASYALGLKDFDKDLSAKLAPVIAEIKKEGLLQFLKTFEGDPLLEIAKRALIPNYLEREKPSLLEKVSTTLNAVLGDNFRKSVINITFFAVNCLFQAYFNNDAILNEIQDRYKQNPSNPISTTERHVKILVARELGLLSNRQATVMRGIQNPADQDKEVSGLALEIKAAVDILDRATDAGILRENTANRRFESILRNQGLDLIRSKLREIDGRAGLAKGIKITSANWEDWDKLITAGEITKAHRVSGS